MLTHHIYQDKHAVHICLVVHEGLLNRLTHSLETSEVYHGVNLVISEDLVHSGTVTNVGLNHCYLMTDDFLYAANGLWLGIVEVIYYHNAMSCLV